jgi:hypothetical protein
MTNIKDRLAKTNISVSNQILINSIGITNVSNFDIPKEITVYPPQKNLLNNPFFPKHLYQTKPKKKK